jgi:RNA polymerase sigma factor (sigma-70 family)
MSGCGSVLLSPDCHPTNLWRSDMTVSRERAAWLGSHIFPHEAALRQWLSRRPCAAGMDVEDVVQESYAILAALGGTDHIQRPRNYFFEVAKSVVLQSLRRSRVVTIDAHATMEFHAIPEDAPTPERIVADRQELAHVATLIDELPHRCGEVFKLRKLHGLSQRDVAARLGISESTVEKHMVKALATLADAIGRGGNRRPTSSRECDPQTQTSPDVRDRHADRA